MKKILKILDSILFQLSATFCTFLQSYHYMRDMLCNAFVSIVATFCRYAR